MKPENACTFRAFPQRDEACIGLYPFIRLESRYLFRRGDNTCGSIYDDDANGVGSGLYGHEQQDMDLYLKEWNYDFIKIDYCGAKELGLEEEKRYATICEAIENTGRTDVSINICRWAFPGTWAKDMARSWRISSDIRPRWSSVKHIIEKNLYLSAYAGEDIIMTWICWKWAEG